MATVSVTIDLDPLSAYYAIHGLSYDEEADPLIRSGVRRLLDLLKEEEVPATFFVTGGTLGEGEWDLLREAVAAGHELADHSFSHDYRLSLRPEADILTDLKRNTFLIRERTGVTPTGFRAPGYNTSPALFAALRAMGYRYDSSLLPSLFYLTAKQTMIWLKRLTGRRSASFVGSLAEAFAPRYPFAVHDRVTAPQDTGPLTEFPIMALLPPIGLPLIGTALITFPSPLVSLMLSRAAKKETVVLELHAIDLCGADDGPQLAPLRGKQPDLSHSVERKQERIVRAIRRFKQAGYTFETLGALAARTA